MKIALIGASGHVGAKLLAEALQRGHLVTAICRHPEALPPHAHMSAVRADVLDSAALAGVLAGHEAVLTAFSPGRGREDPDLIAIYVRGHKAIIAAIKSAGVKRVLAVGGAASLRVPSGQALLDSPEWPPQFYKPAVMGTRELLYLLKAEPDFDWVYLSPPMYLQPGVRTGKYRVGKDDLLYDSAGRSHVSEEDYAVAMLDELEHPRHHRERFTVGY
jgi:putative NADH-flavin reductase